MASKSGLYLVQQVIKAETGRGKKYLRLKLLEKGGRQWPAVFWEEKELLPGQIVDAFVEEGEFNGQAQLDVKALRIVDDPTAVDQFLPKTPYSVDALHKELMDFSESVENPNLRNLLAKVVADPRWRRSPAAQTMHHAYLGGLLEHTVCLLRLAKAVADLYQNDVQRDFLYTAAILHDMGKMQELNSDLNLSYTTEGELLGHISIGMIRASELMNEDPTGFGTSAEPTQLRIVVLHLIGSHHGTPAYGAIKVPMTVEAQVFSNLDGLDANIAKSRTVIARTNPDKEWTEKIKWDEPKYFLGKKEPKS